MRIDKFISSQRTDLSRSDVKKLIRSGRVTKNSEKVRSPETKVDTEHDEIAVDGVKIVFKEHLYIMLNKPKGYICSTQSGKTPSVLELVPAELRRKGLFPAGRLDKDTEGFVLITDDGELAHNMLAPSRHVPKTYYVRLEKPYDKRYEEIFAEGAVIECIDGREDTADTDGDSGDDVRTEKCLPAECTPDPSDPFACTLVLHEGKFHQVKRMFLSVGNRVVYLKRISIGNLPLDQNLPIGECLELLHKDVEKLISQ
jgi:16S rRNA pseudouridine516 synthase